MGETDEKKILEPCFHKRGLTLYHTIPTFNNPKEEDFFENIVGKAENAGNHLFLHFPQCFLPCQRQKSLFQQHSSSTNAINLVKAKILSFDKELMHLNDTK